MTFFDDPAKQKKYEDALMACRDFDPPLTDDEIAKIQSAISFNGTVMLRCKFYNDEKPSILFEASYDSPFTRPHEDG